VSGSLLYGRQGKFTFRLLAVALFGQAVVLSFFALVARANAIAADRPDDGRTLLWVGLGLSALALVAAALMRTPIGLTLGWVVQLLTWLSGVVVPMMIAVGLVFTGLWVLLLVQGRKVDRLVAEREAVAEEGEPAAAD
jgi:Ni/Fe-hydrogenase subunit HybB-like protein